MRIIGRKKEKKEFEKILESDESSFISIYGRRRIGKTYLIKNWFKFKGLFFHLTGIQNASLEIQLQNFAIEFSDHFRKGKEIERPKDWFSAFQMLRKELETMPRKIKKIIFFDELPWLSTPRSMFLQALDHLWNRYLSEMPNIILVVCGSAASWMIDNVINNKGGLHGRITKEIRLLPFTVSETEEFLQAKDILLDRKQILELYMCLGGVAKYLTYLQRGKSVAQMIGEMCFSYNAPLLSEFHKLYRSLFHHHEDHIEIIRAIGKKRSGLSYSELVDQTRFSTGGTLSKRLEELKQSGFIAEMPIFGKSEKSYQYILTDEYSLFYLTWNANVSVIDLQNRSPDYWMKQRNTQKWNSWTSHAYESISLKHVDLIKAALGLSAVQTTTSKWRYVPEKGSLERGAEIDLVIERADQCVNICEIKFYKDIVSIDKNYAEKLQQKRSCFEKITKTKKSTFITLLTTYGARHNQHFFSSVDQELNMDLFFKE